MPIEHTRHREKSSQHSGRLGTRAGQLSPGRTMRQVMTTRCLNVRSDKIATAPVPAVSAIMIAHAGM